MIICDTKGYHNKMELNIFHQETYKVGQNVLIKNANNINDDYIGKILRIMTVKEQKT